MKRFLLLIVFCIVSFQSFSQDVVIWKQILRFCNDRYLPKVYIASKYCYRDTTLLYRMDYSDNGWQIYDSISYTRDNGLWYISYYDATDTDLRLHQRFSDTIQDLYYTNNDLQYIVDKYCVLSYYLNGINELIHQCKKMSPHLIQTQIGDTCYYFFKDVNHTLLFAEYGIPMEESLNNYCCHIGEHGEYDWDKFCFSEYTISRHFDYDKHDNIYKMTITRIHNKTKENVTWIECFFQTFSGQRFGDYTSE